MSIWFPANRSVRARPPIDCVASRIQGMGPPRRRSSKAAVNPAGPAPIMSAPPFVAIGCPLFPDNFLRQGFPYATLSRMVCGEVKPWIRVFFRLCEPILTSINNIFGPDPGRGFPEGNGMRYITAHTAHTEKSESLFRHESENFIRYRAKYTQKPIMRVYENFFIVILRELYEKSNDRIMHFFLFTDKIWIFCLFLDMFLCLDR